VGNFSAISWREKVTFRRDDDDDGHFVLNQRAYIMLIFYRKEFYGRDYIFDELKQQISKRTV
jgi:hypothetical protein